MSSLWVESTYCGEHGDAACDCSYVGRRWRLFTEGVNHGACVSQFHDDGPFYGTWENGGGGRTGAMTTLDACKRRVEQEAMRRARPN